MKNPIAALPILLLAIAPQGHGPGSVGSAWVLSALAAVAQANPQAEDSLIVRRVWAGREPDFYASTPSPDGRYLTEVDWITGDLALIDLVTGELRHVTNKGPWEDSYSYAQSAVFSPDGRRIAYTWFNDEVDGYEIWTIDPSGNEPRVLLRHEPDVAYLQIEDWSLDGADLLVQVRKSNGTTELALVSLDDPEVVYTRESMLGRTYLLDFWATWCGPCVAEMASLHQVHKDYAPLGLEILSVSMDESPDAVRQFRDGEWKMPWLHTQVGGDFQTGPAVQFELIGIPNAILVDADGTIIAFGQENMLGENLREVLVEFLGET